MLPKIEIKNLYKIFHHRISDTVKESSEISEQDKIAIENISLEFNSGESIGIIGRNGAGKSTLLSIIAGLAKQTRGEMNVKGKVTAVMTLGIGLREDLSGRENIYLDGELQGKTRAEIDEVIDEVIEFSELKEFIDKPIKFYSTGMKSRLAFSMLVCIEPEILIIDEALSAGDVFFAEKASKKIKEICKIGKIVLIVSHSMASIQTLCNRCLWIEKGEVELDGDPKEVTNAYLKRIQEEDHSIELTPFQVDVSKSEEWAKYVIQAVNFKANGADYTQRIFHTKDSLLVEIIIQNNETTQAYLDMCIERIDGVIIDRQIVPVSGRSFAQKDALRMTYLQDDTLRMTLELESLVLNKGYYQFKVDLIEDQKISNHVSRFFEVKNNKMASGGYSLLHYPAEIKLLTEEMSTCLDSIEQTVD